MVGMVGDTSAGRASGIVASGSRSWPKQTAAAAKIPVKSCWSARGPTIAAAMIEPVDTIVHTNGVTPWEPPAFMSSLYLPARPCQFTCTSFFIDREFLPSQQLSIIIVPRLATKKHAIDSDTDGISARMAQAATPSEAPSTMNPRFAFHRSTVHAKSGFRIHGICNECRINGNPSPIECVDSYQHNHINLLKLGRIQF